MNISFFYFLFELGQKYPAVTQMAIFGSEHLDKLIFALGLSIVGVYWYQKKITEKTIFLWGSVLIGTYGISWIIKNITQKPRPFLGLSDVVPLISHGGYDSFPSGHATVFFALATIIYFQSKKLGIIFYLGAFFIGVSRVVAGVHYPIDIIGGALIGCSVVWFVKYLFSRKSLK